MNGRSCPSDWDARSRTGRFKPQPAQTKILYNWYSMQLPLGWLIFIHILTLILVDNYQGNISIFYFFIWLTFHYYVRAEQARKICHWRPTWQLGLIFYRTTNKDVTRMLNVTINFYQLTQTVIKCITYIVDVYSINYLKCVLYHFTIDNNVDRIIVPWCLLCHEMLVTSVVPKSWDILNDKISEINNRYYIFEVNKSILQVFAGQWRHLWLKTVHLFWKLTWINHNNNIFPKFACFYSWKVLLLWWHQCPTVGMQMSKICNLPVKYTGN